MMMLCHFASSGRCAQGGGRGCGAIVVDAPLRGGAQSGRRECRGAEEGGGVLRPRSRRCRRSRTCCTTTRRRRHCPGQTRSCRTFWPGHPSLWGRRTRFGRRCTSGSLLGSTARPSRRMSRRISLPRWGPQPVQRPDEEQRQALDEGRAGDDGFAAGAHGYRQALRPE